MSKDSQKGESIENVAGKSDSSQEIQMEDSTAVHLEDRLQRRNIIIYVLKWCILYLAAPILYVGFVQAGLCKRLGASDFVANLPSAVYLLMLAVPVIMAWAFPQVRYLKLIIAIGYSITAVVSAITAAVIWLPAPDWLCIGMVIGHGAAVACSNGTAWAFEWEILGRGISESRRGLLFAITFSVGPLFAVAGSLGTQLIVNNEIFGWAPHFWHQIPYPLSYVILYGATCPLMLVAAALVLNFVVPLPAMEAHRKPFIQTVFGGFIRFIGYRLILIACIAYLLVFSGTMIQNNMVLYTREMVEMAEDTFVGYQLAIRFGCKIIAGLLLGWCLKVTNPRMTLLATTLLILFSIVWILSAKTILGGGLIFLFAFGFNGGGELMGHYYPYYILCLSPKSQMRRNMAFLMLLAAPVGFMPALYGLISDTWNLTASFWISLVITAVGLILVITMLPARPQPKNLEAADSR